MSGHGLTDLAGRDHWERVWRRQRPARVRRLNYYHVRLDRVFREWLPPSARVLEVGCGGSRWLAHLIADYDCDAWGIDYSAEGVRLARRNLDVLGLGDRGRIVEGDFFESTMLPTGSFDLVYSMGFIEHFADPERPARRMAELLRPNGLSLQLVPNLQGFVGWLHRAVDREIFEKHVVITPDDLDRVHRAVGFRVERRAAYAGVFGLTVVNYTRLRRRLPRPVDRSLWVGLHAFQQLVCLGPRLTGLAPESRRFSPWIIGVYRRAP